jgi:hypothetical protein
MKVKKIVKSMYAAIFAKDLEEEKRLWLKAIKKSLKGKNTQAIK